MTQGGRGWFGNGRRGCDYQFAGQFGNWVVGIFGGRPMDQHQGQFQLTAPAAPRPRLFQRSQKLDSTWAVGGRIGYCALPGLLTYFNGGWTEAHFSGVNYYRCQRIHWPTPVVSLGTAHP